jgi:propionyl-CoA carboxylase alpha chain
MNTRLQVEHRVTELVTGIDLVEQMIRIAAGEKLSFGQKDVKLHGWAFEARIYAEDPKRGFLPSTGRITRYLEPEIMENVLIDTGVYEGGEASMFYDPMVAKVCSWGETRGQAIDTLREALSAFIIEGISHNASFLEAISQQLPGRERAIGAHWVANVDGEDYPVYVRHDQDQGYFITHNRKLISVKTAWKLGRRLFQATINSKPVSVQIKHLEEGYILTYGGSDVTVRVRTPRVAELAQFMPKPKDQNKKEELKAPIAGLVVSLKVKEGDDIKAGQELMVIEAMKMENVIYADHDTSVKKVLVGEKESVAVDQVMMQFAA